FDTLLPIKLTNEDIRNSNAYQEYYVVATGDTPPKPKASVRKTRSSFDTTITPPTTAAEKGNDDEQASDEEEFIHPSLSTHAEEEPRDEEIFDHIPKTPEDTDDEGNGEENLGLNFGREEGHDEEEDRVHPYNDEFLKTIDENMQKIIKEQVKEQVKVQVSKILPKIEQTVNEQLEANFSEFMQTNQFAGAVSAILGIVQRYMDQWMNEAVKVAVQIQSDCLHNEAQADNNEFLKTIDENMQKIIKEQVKEQVKNPPLDQTGGPRDAEKERSLSQQALQMRKPLGALAGQNKGLNLNRCWQARLLLQRSLCRLPLRWKSPHIQSLKQGFSHWRRKRQQFYGFAVNRESARDVYSKRRIIIVTELKIVEWHNYKHLDWIMVRRDDDKLYKFKEGDFKRLRIQDIEDMLMLLVQGKLTNLTVEERFAFNVSLRMFTRSVVIQRRVEDLQLGVGSYQKKLNLTKPDTYRSNLKRKEAYIAYSNPRGFIYQNKDKKNRLMRIDELHKFSDGTLTDVRTALDDRLKGIQMQYLPQSIWRKSNKDRAAAMIHAIDKRLKTRRIMRSLERFVGGRLYEGDFRMLQRTI
nr:hypothetical protein [Tanacetum cinerariifolium]